MLPAASGVYAIELWLASPCTLPVGRLGTVAFPAGAYVYLGSACGPGGLRGRLQRHLLGKGSTRPHWHIDALRAITQVQAYAALAFPGGSPVPPGLECRLTRLALSWPGAVVPAPAFGASDCRQNCPAHLVAFPGQQEDARPILQSPSVQTALQEIASQVGSKVI